MTRRQLDSFLEKGVIGILLIVLVFGPLATGAVRAADFLVIQGLTILGLLLWSLRIWLSPSHRLLFPPVCWAILAFIIYAVIRFRQAELEYVAQTELMRILVYGGVFFLVMNHLHRQDTTQLVGLILLFLGMAISVYAIYQFITKSPYVWHFKQQAQYIGRGAGTYICPNHLAGFLEMILPVGLAYLFVGRFNHTFKVFLGYACLVILAGIGVTQSRGGWVATGVALAIFFLLLLRKRQYRLPAIVLLVAMVVGGAILYKKSDRLQDRIKKARQGGSVSAVSTRPLIWNASYNMWRDHTLLGVGPGHFDYKFQRYRPNEIQVRPGYVHNDYLNVLVDYGIVGGFLLAVVGAGFLFGLLKTRKYVERQSQDLGSRRNSNRAAFVLGGSIGLLALGIHSMVDFNMQIPANAMTAVVFMALVAAHVRFATERFWVSSWWGYKVCASALILTTAGHLSVQGWVRAKETHRLAGVDRTDYPSEKRVEALKLAVATDPSNFSSLYRLGNNLRLLGWSGHDHSTERLEEAMQWFSQATELNPEDPYNPLETGMCLVQLGRIDEARSFFNQALALDPNNHFIVAHLGWYQMNRGDFQAARSYFEDSLEIKWWDNHIPLNYLRILDQQKAEQ